MARYTTEFRHSPATNLLTIGLILGFKTMKKRKTKEETQKITKLEDAALTDIPRFALV